MNKTLLILGIVFLIAVAGITYKSYSTESSPLQRVNSNPDNSVEEAILDSTMPAPGYESIEETEVLG